MNVAIIGFGIEGRSALHYWQEQGAHITVCDHNTDVALPENVASQLGEHYLHNLARFDVVVRSAGIPPEVLISPNPGIEHKITTVVNEFVKVCPTRNIIGITGTKGKGTTSTMTKLMLETAGYKVFLGGNIGNSPFDFLGQLTEDAWVVLELSSYQLQDFTARVPLAACLMMAEEHLTWHHTAEKYFSAKQNLFGHQEAADTAIYFADNERSHAIASTSPGKKIPYFAPPGAYMEDGRIVIDDQEICAVDDLQLLGKHNWQNACAAATIVWQIFQKPDVIASVLTSFTGLPHRLEFVREHNGIRYFNDSFASAPPAAAAAAQAIAGSKVMILGGFDRNLALEEMVAGIHNERDSVRAMLLVGASAERLASELDAAGLNNFQVSTAATMDQIVDEATALAKPGDAVVLSPGFPSFDMFTNFEERGLAFKKSVSEL